MTNTQQKLIQLISASVTDEGLPHQFYVCDDEWKYLVDFSRRAGISALLYFAAKRSDVHISDEIWKRIKSDALQSSMTAVLQMDLYYCITEAFEVAGIDYMPLKGLVVHSVYPKSELRAMGDLDILIRSEQYDQIVPIMLKLGLKQGVESDYEYAWNSVGGVHIELHKHLLSPVNNYLFAYYSDAWAFAKPKTKYEYEMTPEDFYSFLIVHYAKHFRKSGIGIRHLLDLWLYRREHKEIEEERILIELDKMRLRKFGESVLRAIDALFNDGELDEKANIIIDNAFESGTFGSGEMMIKGASLRAAQENGGSWLKYLLHAAFPSYQQMKMKYTEIEGKPAMLPLYWIKLWKDVLFKRKNAIRNVLQIADGFNDGTAKERMDMLKKVGIEYFRGELKN